MNYLSKPLIALSASIIFLSMLLGCQRVEDSRIELTQSQWQRIEAHLIDEAPAPEYSMDVRFDDDIELIGLDVDGDLVAGELVELTWYWQAHDDIDRDWQIFVHFDSRDEPYRQNLDHFPLGEEMNNVYRTYHWRSGDIIEDVQRVRLADDYPAGDARFYVGLFRGDTRADVTNDAEATTEELGPRAIGPTVEIQAAAQPPTDAPEDTESGQSPAE